MDNKSYFEIVLDKCGTSFLVAGTEKPTIEEAAEFWKEDIDLIGGKGTKIHYIREVDYEEAVSSFDMDNSERWPVFDRTKIAGIKSEKVFKRCPKCNYHHFASVIKIEQKALIGGEGEYIDEYESELSNPIISDEAEWCCTRCGHKAPGSEFSVFESKLKDAELEDVFSIYPDPVSDDINVFYKGNECIGEADKDATAKEIRDEIAQHGYYVVDDEMGTGAKVYPLRYSAEITVSNKIHSLSATINNIKSPDELVWMLFVDALYRTSPDFKADDELDYRMKITACDGVIYGDKAKTVIAENGTLDY